MGGKVTLDLGQAGDFTRDLRRGRGMEKVLLVPQSVGEGGPCGYS